MIDLSALIVIALLLCGLIYILDKQRSQTRQIKSLRQDVANLEVFVEKAFSRNFPGQDTEKEAPSAAVEKRIAEAEPAQRSSLIPASRMDTDKAQAKPPEQGPDYEPQQDAERGISDQFQPQPVAASPIETPKESVKESPESPSKAPSKAAETSVSGAISDAEHGHNVGPDSLDEPIAEEVSRPKIDFEELFGRRLPIWAGGVALAVAGFFLVRYSIEQGMLSPPVRIFLGFVFGAGLLVAAEIAFRQEARVQDPRVRQALAGAGLATLYGCFFMAGSQYGLIGSGAAFVGLALVTAAAIALSFRFGLPCAILGLVGGFAAPMLVGGEEANLPLLSIYLALVTAGLSYTGRKQGRSWLGVLALSGGLGWGILVLIGGIDGTADVLAIGGYLVVLGAIIPALISGPSVSSWMRILAAGMAASQLAVMVYLAGFTFLAWGLYGLLGAALAFFAWREPRLKEASAFGGLLGVFMAGLWPHPALGEVAAVAAMLLVIFAIVPLAALWRDRGELVDALQLSGVSLATIALILFHFYTTAPLNLLAIFVLGISMIPALGAWISWPKGEGNLSTSSLACACGAAIGIAVAGLVAVPAWAAPLVIAVVTMGVITLNWRRCDPGLLALSWVGAGAGVFALLTSPDAFEELPQLVSDAGITSIWRSALRWAAICVPLLALAWQKQGAGGQRTAAIFAALGIYAVAAQILPAQYLAWFAAIMAGAMALWLRQRLAARLTFTVLTLAWALPLLGIWATAAVQSIVGQPMFIADAISLHDIGLYLLPMLAAGATCVWRPAQLAQGARMAPIWSTLSFAALVGVHILYKQIFALSDEAQFITWGLAERTIWEALLVAGSIAASRFATQIPQANLVARGLVIAALAHFTLYSFLLHNPLWAEQSVGALPVLNWLTASYGAAMVGLWQLSRLDWGDKLRIGIDIAEMVLVAFWSLSLLRNIFAGSILVTVPVEQLEYLLWSVLGIALAIGYLLWAAHSQKRSWRVGSLVLMLLSVVKVFVFDAAGLGGLARIASFMALGISLIGIGWFYSRLLSAPKNNAAKEEPKEQPSPN